MDFPPELGIRWDLASVAPLADTRTSRVFRVTRRDGSPAIAKILKLEGLHEWRGFDFLGWRHGAGCVRLLATEGSACLLEDAGTVDLRAWRMENSDTGATDIIASVVRQMHTAGPAAYSVELLPLHAHFQALFSQAETAPASLQDQLRWCAGIATSLIENQSDIRPLHGDLHHENILSGSGRGWLAIDPQGLVGDSAYDVANVFGNPDGAFPEIISPDRISALLRTFATVTGCSEEKILRYAIAHTGLSISWALEDGLPIASGSDASERLAFLSVAKRMLDGLPVRP